MLCKKCNKDIADDFIFCPYCGAKITNSENKPKKRGNGQGTVYKSGNKYVAVVTLGYYIDDNGITKRKTRSKYFDKKKDAVAALPELKQQIKQIDDNIKFKELYDEFLKAHEEKGTSKSTLDCYRSAVKYFEPLYYTQFKELVTEHYQNCVDNCPHGRRTRENMKALVGLMYKQAGRRGMSLTDFSKYIFIKKDEQSKERDAFTAEELEILKKNLDTVPFAKYIYLLCYTGYRINEFLSRKKSDLCCITVKKKPIYYITGGNKTTAGKNKIVTVSPKILDIVLDFVVSGMFTVFQHWFNSSKERPLDDLARIVANLSYNGINGIVKDFENKTE